MVSYEAEGRFFWIEHKEPLCSADISEAGEIALKSPSMMLGYYKNPKATHETLRDGWLLTGDVDVNDVVGYLWMCLSMDVAYREVGHCNRNSIRNWKGTNCF